MTRRRCLWVLAVLAAPVAMGLAIGLTVVRGGISALPEPSSLEVSVARSLRSWLVPGRVRHQENPILPSAQILAEARAHWADHCASCHGNDGSGQTELGRNLYPRAPDMRLPATQNLSDGELFYIIENGVKLTGMPGWGRSGAPEQSWLLVHFIRHLPQLGADEKAEMEGLNPRSRGEWLELQEEEDFLRGGDTDAQRPAARMPLH